MAGPVIATATGVIVLVIAIPFKRSVIPQSLIPQMTALRAEVDSMPDLFASPSPQLQTDFFARRAMTGFSKELVKTLYTQKEDLPLFALKQAALLAFALEDYKVASVFAQLGLKLSPQDKEIAGILGLINYEQSSYLQAAQHFQNALLPGSRSGADSRFDAAMIGNEGFSKWDLGQTEEAELSLNRSLGLFKEEGEPLRQVFILLSQADAYTEYGQPEKALEANNRALDLANSIEKEDQEHIYKGRIYRLQAKSALYHGLTQQAIQKIDQAISIHKSAAFLLDLARDMDVSADIAEQTGSYQPAMEILKESARYYEEIGYIKGKSENLLRQAHILNELNRYEEASSLVAESVAGFSELEYERGLGEADFVTGNIILRQAGHDYLQRYFPGVSRDKAQEAAELLFKEAQRAYEKFGIAIERFRAIGYKRGVARALDKLAISIVSAKNPADLSEAEFLRAVQVEQESISAYREIGDRRGLAEATGNLGTIYRRRADFEQSIRYLENSLAICREIDFKLGIGRQLFNIGRLYIEMGDKEANDQAKTRQNYLQARDYFKQAKKVFIEIKAGKDELGLIKNYLASRSIE